jgi:gas vesicle protein
MNDLIDRIRRELPDTDKDRYDIAFDRGRAQARSWLLFGGLLLGLLAGAAAMFLFDPRLGTGRRAELASRATGIRNDLARTAESRMEDLQNRAKGAAIETGISQPEEAEAELQPV